MMSRRTRPTPRSAVGISGPRRLGIYAVGVGIWLTGVFWLLFHYFLVRQGELGPSPHQLEPWWLELHGAFAFASIWTVGSLWEVHVSRNWPVKQRRWSGSALVGILLWLILSGYLLYYLGDERVRPIVSILHWALGLVIPLSFLVHRFAWPRRRRAVPDRGETPGIVTILPRPTNSR